MDEWQTMFTEVQSIMSSGGTLAQSLKRAINFADSNPLSYSEPDYWSQVQQHDFRLAFNALIDCAKQGLESLDAKAGWEFLLLDMGDCPESFRLYRPGGQHLMSEQKFRDAISQQLIVGVSDLEGCFGPDTPDIFDPFGQLFGNQKTELSNYHVSELGDKLLDWTGRPESNWHGNSGYFLWLMLGSLALVEPLRDPAYCKTILQERDQLYLLPGYEEIFFHGASITPEGIIFGNA